MIYFRLSRETKTFSGKVTITGQAQSDRISLHQKDLEIASSRSRESSSSIYSWPWQWSPSYRIGWGWSSWTGYCFFRKNTDNMTGIYPSYYTCWWSQEGGLVYSVREPFCAWSLPMCGWARSKATFDLALRFDQAEGEVALSNMPEIDVENRKETGIWKFETTPRMSSYLLAFVEVICKGWPLKLKTVPL